MKLVKYLACVFGSIMTAMSCSALFEDFNLPGHDTMQSGRLVPELWKNLQLPSAQNKAIPC